jgi:hypothetical protein
MKANRSAPCISCYRVIPKGAEVQYSKARRGIRHPVCPPISTAELQAGRARYEAQQQADIEAEEARRYARFDAANPTWKTPA